LPSWGHISGDTAAVHGLATDPSGDVWVATGPDVEKFDGDGDLLSRWPVPATAIAIDTRGDVYLALADGYFSPDTTDISKYSASGNLIKRWPLSGSNFPGLVGGLAVDDRERVFASDQRFERVTVFDADGRYLGAWGSNGTGSGQFVNAAGIAVAHDGTVYVADSKANDVERFGGLLDPLPSDASQLPTLQLPPTSKVTATRIALLKMRCNGPRGQLCAGSLRLAQHGRRRTVARTRFSIPTARTRTLRVKLSRSASTALRRRGRLGVTLAIAYRGAKPRVERRPLTLTSTGASRH
jgi:hypothetical protein